MVLTAIGGATAATIEYTAVPVEAATIPEIVEEKNITTNEEAEVLLKEVFADIPVMIEIAKCESGLKHFNEKGEVLRGVINPLDTGIFQINSYYHKKTAEKMGIDIETAEGNIAYAKILYEQSGVSPWKASIACHNAS